MYALTPLGPVPLGEMESCDFCDGGQFTCRCGQQVPMLGPLVFAHLRNVHTA
jgi:hypothetical protein